MIGAVDIGGTKIAVGVVDDHGKVLSRTQSPTDPENYSGGIDLIARMLRQTAQKAGVGLSGIGIGSTGPVDPMRGEFVTLISFPDGVVRVRSGTCPRFSTYAWH